MPSTKGRGLRDHWLAVTKIQWNKMDFSSNYFKYLLKQWAGWKTQDCWFWNPENCSAFKIMKKQDIPKMSLFDFWHQYWVGGSHRIDSAPVMMFYSLFNPQCPNPFPSIHYMAHCNSSVLCNYKGGDGSFHTVFICLIWLFLFFCGSAIWWL